MLKLAYVNFNCTSEIFAYVRKGLFFFALPGLFGVQDKACKPYPKAIFSSGESQGGVLPPVICDKTLLKKSLELQEGSEISANK